MQIPKPVGTHEMSRQLAVVFILLWTVTGSVQSATDGGPSGTDEGPSGTDEGPSATEQAAQDVVEFSLSNIKRGKQLFTVHCVSCHGMDGRGDTEMREFLKTPPADLSDDQWLYGGSEAVLFNVVKEGRTARDMPAFNATLSDQRIWQLVTYMRYLGGERP